VSAPELRAARGGTATARGRSLSPMVLVEEGARHLASADVPEPRMEAEVLLSAAFGCDRLHLYTGDVAVVGRAVRVYRGLIERRAAGEPSAYCTGEREFYSLSFEVGPGVLIPRPETETLVEAALARLQPGARVADIGTGSGCVAIAVALRVPESVVFAVDCSEKGLAVARRNVRRHGLDGHVRLLAGDLLAPLADACLPGSLDAILSNPPYIPTAVCGTLQREVRDFEPRAALDGGPDGLDVIRRLVGTAAPWLKPGGLFAFEVGAGQAGDAVRLLAGAGAWGRTWTVKDLAGIERVVCAERR